MYVLKRTSYVRPEKDVFYTYLWDVQKKSSLMHTTIHCAECPAYIYFLHRMSIKRVDHLTSCNNILFAILNQEVWKSLSPSLSLS